MIDWKLDHAALRQQQNAALAAQLQSVWQRSRFYRDAWGIKPDLEGFGRLPLVTKAQFHHALDEGFLGSNLATSRDQLVHIHTSSGTSGRPTYFGLTRRDYDAWKKIFIRGFELAGVRPGDRVLHAFAMSRGYAGGVPMIEAFEAMGCVALPIGAEAGSARLIDVVHRLVPDVLYASPSMARRLAHAYGEEFGSEASSTSIRLVLTGGEPGAGDPASKRQLAEAWNAEVRECGGGTDVSPLMVMECAAHSGLHFVAGDEVLFELINPESGEIVPLGARSEGEIVYTHLFREANPVVRMRHGDVVVATTEHCQCGLDAPRIWFQGRSDDMLIVRGVKVFPSSIQAVVSHFAPALSGAFAVRRPRPGAIDAPLKLVCECASENDATELRVRFERRARELIGVRVECQFVAVGTLGVDRAQKATWMVDDD